MYARMYMYVCMCDVCMHACLYVCIYVRMYVDMNASMYKCMYLCMYICMCVYVPAYQGGIWAKKCALFSYHNSLDGEGYPRPKKI